MRVSILSIAPFFALANAVALPNPQGGSSSDPKPWDIVPSSFKPVGNVAALSSIPSTTKGVAKREAEANAVEERQAPFNWVLTYTNPYNSVGTNTYYYLPYVQGTCFSFQYSNLDNVLSAVNILRNGVYCYFFTDYVCGYANGYTYATYSNTPLNANVFQDNTWSSYICYGV